MLRRFAAGLLALGLTTALFAAGGEPWKDKAASQWTQEEATREIGRAHV